MDKESERFILEMLNGQPVLTLATNREDGWPQATSMGYVNEGLSIYLMAFSDSQKVRNIERDPRVSLTVDSDEPDWSKTRGLSMAAMAEVVTDVQEADHVQQLMTAKFPQFADYEQEEGGEAVVFLRLTPKYISVVNYEKGMGYRELIEV